jgi:hypothetical protein
MTWFAYLNATILRLPNDLPCEDLLNGRDLDIACDPLLG